MKKQCIVCHIADCSLHKNQNVIECPINKFLHVMGRKRGFIVLLVLENPHRFGELKKTIPDITEKMLITTLHQLEDVGYISNKKITGKHLQSTYHITELGKKALKIGDSMAELGKLIK